MGKSSNIFVSSTNEPNTLPLRDANGDLALDAVAVTGDITGATALTMDGTANRTTGTQRNTTSNTAGKRLTVTGGSAANGATNKAGGDIYLTPGLGTGTGASGSVIAQAHAAGGSGTTDGTLATVATIDSTGLTLVGNVVQSGLAARTTGMARHSTADTAGNTLTVSAGGATLAATNKAGGGLYLDPGIGTGSAASGSVYVRAAAAGGGGTSDNALATVATFDSTGLTLVGNVVQSGLAARTTGMARHVTADTAGQGLTVDAGGAASGATNKAGGDLTLQSGYSTGSGSSSILFKTPTAGGSGTTDRTPATVLTLTSAAATFVPSIVTRAATTAAGTAPIKLVAGTLMTAPEAGAIELDANYFYFTDGAGNRRFHLESATDMTKTVGGAPYANDGYITINVGSTTYKVMTTA